MFEMNPRTMNPRFLRLGQVILDDGGMPVAVVSSRAHISRDGTVRVATRRYPDGPYDVRKFSSRHETRPTLGVESVESWPTFASASARRDRINRQRTRESMITWHTYAGLYHNNTGYCATLANLEPGEEIEFPPGTDVTVAWMGPHPAELVMSRRVECERYTMRTSDTYPGDRVERHVRGINGHRYEFSRIVWGDGSVTIRVHRYNSTDLVHEWTSCGVLAQS